MTMSFSNNLPQPSEEVMQYLRDGQKLQAVKAYKEETGCDLKDAKDIIDAIDLNEKSVPAAEKLEDFDEEIINLVKSGNKLQAVKLYKEKNLVNLKDAKDAIDELYYKLNGTHDKGRSGCLGIMLLLFSLPALGLLCYTLLT